VTVAGKTGTSDDLRDSWFAGFTNDRLIVAWLGADDNRPIGFTGSSGAAKIWARVMSSVEASSYRPPQPETLASVWIDYETGRPSASRCSDALMLPVPEKDRPRRGYECDGTPESLGARVRRLLRHGDE
jgi:penicillin-binding protein 1B